MLEKKKNKDSFGIGIKFRTKLRIPIFDFRLIFLMREDFRIKITITFFSNCNFYQNPPKMGANIYIYNCNVSHYNRNYLEKCNVNQTILTNKMCLEFNFTYALQILLGSVNKYVTS